MTIANFAEGWLDAGLAKGLDLTAALAIFELDEFTDWFRDERAYWYKDIFG